MKQTVILFQVLIGYFLLRLELGLSLVTIHTFSISNIFNKLDGPIWIKFQTFQIFYWFSCKNFSLFNMILSLQTEISVIKVNTLDLCYVNYSIFDNR